MYNDGFINCFGKPQADFPKQRQIYQLFRETASGFPETTTNLNCDLCDFYD